MPVSARPRIAQKKPPLREAFGCSDYVFSNSFLEDQERLWELRNVIPDTCNPHCVIDEITEGIE